MYTRVWSARCVSVELLSTVLMLIERFEEPMEWLPLHALIYLGSIIQEELRFVTRARRPRFQELASE